MSHRFAQSRTLPAACRRGYINLYTLYIFWLCSAVFVHLPSLQSMGFDVRADITMLITILLLSLLVRNQSLLLAHTTWLPGNNCISLLGKGSLA